MSRFIVTLALASSLFTLTAHAQDADGDGLPDAVDAFPCDPRGGSVVYSPAEGQYGSLLYEDLFPNTGDADFNDLVVLYNYAFVLDAQGLVTAVRAVLRVEAAGGDTPGGLGLHLPVDRSAIASVTRTVATTTTLQLANDTEATMVVSQDVAELFANPARPINSDPNRPYSATTPITVDIVFTAPTAMPLARAPFDVYWFDATQSSREVHRPGYSGTNTMNATLFGTGDDASIVGRWFVDTRGIPFALHFPVAVRYPAEGIDIALLYPDIIPFGLSAGTSNAGFYNTNVNVAFAYAPAGMLLPIPTAPSYTGGPTPPIDASTSCLVTHYVQCGGRQGFAPYEAVEYVNGAQVITQLPCPGGHAIAAMPSGTTHLRCADGSATAPYWQRYWLGDYTTTPESGKNCVRGQIIALDDHGGDFQVLCPAESYVTLYRYDFLGGLSPTIHGCAGGGIAPGVGIYSWAALFGVRGFVGCPMSGSLGLYFLGGGAASTSTNDFTSYACTPGQPVDIGWLP